MGRPTGRSSLLVLAAAAALVACADDSGVLANASDASQPAPQFARTIDLLSGGFQSPIRVALTPRGDLLVSDSRLHLIATVDPTTREPGRAMEVRGMPLAVGMLGGRIFVGNATTQRVEVYNHRGQFWYAFGASVAYPTDLAIDTTRNLVFVVDALARDVKVFDFKGGLQRIISGPGSDPAALLHIPTGIAVDPVRQEILVSDYPDPAVGGSAAVRIYAYDGSLVQVLSPGGCGFMGCTGGFSRPQGIALDGRGRIYLADAFLAQVLVFDRATLRLVKTLGGRDAGPPQLRIPMDLVVGPGGGVFVTSNRTGSVEAFRGGAVP